MVHLTGEPLARSFGAQIADLKRGIAAAWSAESPEAGFVEWTLVASDTNLDVDLAALDFDALPAQRWTEAPVLASVGFRLDVATFPDHYIDRWVEGVGRLMTREVLPADRNSFFFRPVELLGLAVGARAVEQRDASAIQWLKQIVDDNWDRLPASTLWSRVLAWVTAKRVRATNDRLEPAVAVTELDVALMLWLDLSDNEMARKVTTSDASALRVRMLETAAVDRVSLHGVAEQGLFLIALYRAVVAAVGALDLGGSKPALFVVNLCRRFPLLVSELQNRYNKRAGFDVTDEYDVQDLLRSVLRLHFTDVRPEEWNPSYGGVQSRSDLFLKPERVVIETKMTRSGLGQRQLVQELIVDKAQYQGHPDCKTLVCFVYDPEQRLANPDAIEVDLSDHTGSLETLVVVSPRGL